MRIWRKEKENLLQRGRRKHRTAIPPPATFIITPSIKHAARYHWRRREGEKWEEKETEEESLLSEPASTGLKKAEVVLLDSDWPMVRPREELCFLLLLLSPVCPPFLCLLLFLSISLSTLFLFSSFLFYLSFSPPSSPLHLPPLALSHLLILFLLPHLNCPSSSPL